MTPSGTQVRLGTPDDIDNDLSCSGAVPGDSLGHITRESTCSNARPRDVFPLPLLEIDSRLDACAGRQSRSRAAKGAYWRKWCNEGLSTLNWLHAGTDRDKPVSQFEDLPACGKSAVDHLSAEYRSFEVPGDYSERRRDCEAALGELLAAAPGYFGDSGRVRAYNKPLVAWPDVSTPTPVCSVVSSADASVLSGWRQSMLRSQEDTSQLRDQLGVSSPYVDPQLRFNPRTYAEF